MNLNIWVFQRMLSRRLTRWAGVSALIGSLLLRRRGFWRAVGGQFVGWAAVNLGIALFGSISADHRRQRMESPDAPEVLAKEARSLRRLLWINAGLDLLYMFGGRWLARRDTPNRRGMGVGIVLQGLFLLIFDLWHALVLRESPDEGTDAASRRARPAADSRGGR
ncbi:MAG: hypothetical protein L6Q98_22425 [Anaerolineae bacterium]|nr:hypothetical protein [Anaerolineae bacterium]NUQ06631.1 hypothetical protein [Anaerolineae bacterium]